MKKLIVFPEFDHELQAERLCLLLNDSKIYNSIFTDEELENIPVNGIEFNECQFYKIKMSDSFFHNVQFVDVEFHYCDFSNSNFELCSFVRCRFIQCKLLGSNLLDSYFHNVTFSGLLRYINFAHNKFKKVLFEKALLTDGRFLENNFFTLYFEDCDMANLEFSSCNLKGIDLSSNHIDGIRIHPLELKGVIVNSYQACLIAEMLGVIIEG